MSNPLKPNFRSEWYAILLLLLFLLSAFVLRLDLPARVAIHWDLNGNPDGYGSPVMAAWFLPLLAIALYALLMSLPRFDPKKEHYQDFRKSYHYFKDFLISFLFAIYWLANLKVLGYAVNFNLAFPLVLGVFFFGLGFFLKPVRPNWFMGIRTPWTLSSETVWAKTHQAAPWFFALSAVMIILIAFLPLLYKNIVLVVAILIIAVGLPLYSYLLWRHEQPKNKS